MPKRYHLSCLGDPTLRGPDTEPVRFGVRKHLALLVYLATENHGAQRRDHLTELLWPDAQLPKARQSLATALSVLRARLAPGSIDATREKVRLDLSFLEVDILRLETGRIVPEPGMPPLVLAGFLAEFELPNAPGFMLWRDQQQARWLPLVRSGLMHLIDHCRRTGDSGSMERHAERLLRVDGLAEGGVLARMEARAMAGDRITALRIFEEWTLRADRELGVAPSAALEGMALRLRRRGWDRITGIDIPPVHTDQWRGRPFVGRAAEYQMLYEVWETARRAQPSHVLVTGDSGVGKSTLVARLATAAGLEGATVGRVQCFELEQSIPYAAVSGLLVRLLDRPGAAATRPGALAELGRTIGEVHRRFRDLPLPSESQGETARIHFAEAALELLRAVMDEHPLILVMDDYHLADEASLAILHFLLRSVESGPLTMLLTSRPQHVGESPNAARIRQGADYLRLRLTTLEPMAGADAGVLLDSLLDPEDPRPTPTQRRALLHAGAGYPMVIELLVQDWKARGEDSVALAVDAMTESLSAGPPDEAYRRLFERVMADLDPTARSVLNLASILDRRLNELEMYALVDVTMGQALVALADLARCRALRDGGHGLEFVNQAIRAQAYLSVPWTIRRMLHGHVADRLLIRDEAGGEGEVSGLEIAWHCTRAGRTVEATPYLLRGAREAIRRGAPHEAELALRSGFAVLSGVARAEAHLLLAEVLQEQSRHSESLEVLDACRVQTNPESGERERLLRIAACTTLSEGPQIPVDTELANWHLVEEGSTLSTRVLAIANAASSTTWMRTPTNRVRLRSAVHATSLHQLTSEQRAWLHFSEARIEYFSGNNSQSLGKALEALRELDEDRIKTSLWVRLHVGLSAISCSSGDYTNGLSHAYTAHSAAIALGNDQLAGIAANNAAICSKQLGKTTDQIKWARTGCSLLRGSQLLATELSAKGLFALGMAMSGDDSKTLNSIHKHFQCTALERDDFIGQQAAFWCSDTYAVLGKTIEAIRWSRFGTDGHNSELKSRSHAGSFARAVWRTAVVDGTYSGAADRIRSISHSLDAIDQAEALTCLLSLSRLQGHEEKEIADELKSVLEKLPEGIVPSLVRQESQFDRGLSALLEGLCSPLA